MAVQQSAQQADALTHNPNKLNLTCVATYQRKIGASIARAWENVLDWEHLPWLHDTSFDYVSLDVAGEWGWRTWSNSDRTDHVELCVNRGESEYVARSYKQGKQISEIWTRLSANHNSTDIVVTFEIPDVAPEHKDKMGEFFLKLYGQLWDEDEEMMQKREARLAQRFSAVGPRQITLTKPIDTPLTVSLGHGDWTLRHIDGELIVHSAICPHLLGPLDDSIETKDGTVRCPWHGYEFDIKSGNCLTSGAAPCKLKQPPVIIDQNNHITLSLDS